MEEYLKAPPLHEGQAYEYILTIINDHRNKEQEDGATQTTNKLNHKGILDSKAEECLPPPLYECFNL